MESENLDEIWEIKSLRLCLSVEQFYCFGQKKTLILKSEKITKRKTSKRTLKLRYIKIDLVLQKSLKVINIWKDITRFVTKVEKGDKGLLCFSRVFHRCLECKKIIRRNFTLIFRSHSPHFPLKRWKKRENLYSLRPRLWTRWTNSRLRLCRFFVGRLEAVKYFRLNIACAKISIRGCASSDVTRPSKWTRKILSQKQVKKCFPY